MCKVTLACYGAKIEGTFGNDALGQRRFLAALPQGAHLIIEASGGYERELVLKAHRAGIMLSVVNPRQVRDFARGVGRRAKNDPIDAQMLARFGSAVGPAPDPCPSATQLELSELVTVRQQLVEQRTVLLQQRSQHVGKLVRTLDRSHLRVLNNHIAKLESAINAILLQDEVLAQKAERLQQPNGVGLITAVTCLALCPELGSLNRGQVAALVGVAPYDDDSGPRKGWRHIAGGRARLRCALYMAALSAIRSNQTLRRFYQQLRQRNKPAKVALTAVMRKLAILLNQLLKDPSFQLAT